MSEPIKGQAQQTEVTNELLTLYFLLCIYPQVKIGLFYL